MTSKNKAGTEYDTVTGEVIERPEAKVPAPAAAVEPTKVATGADLARMPGTLAELAELFTAPEPEPREVWGAILGIGELQQQEAEDTSRAILAQIMQSTTAEEMLSVHKVVHAQDVLNVQLDVRSVKWQRSTLNGAAKVYAVMRALPVDTETEITITCSGRNVMAALLNAQVRGFLPLRCRIDQSTNPTANGYRPLWLEPA